MEIIEIVAIIILVIAILVLVYYYLLNTPAIMNKLKSYVPTNADAHMSEVISKNTDYNDLEKEKESKSMTKRIKVKLSDIDMSSINTDAFSSKLDAFLDEKSDELIKDWSLATTDDLEDLEAKFLETTKSVDALDKDYQEFKKSSKEFQEATEEKLNDIDKRIEALEK
ncbi:MAG: hypothetical protein E7Z73_05505 [Methanobrevibacter millerae]|uniref:Uncharacterized protein n=1 Tax=Methanobrevibacter millerae TaxID=230361 RepID=A0A8T3VIQ9_9EURY|nr:hypothetical protein [Methanobrevibacter millerae]MBE6505183.1 hypothetical protein [Methanobrevibacter millerae]